MNKYKVLLVDDENLLLDSLEVILTLNQMEIVGKANDGNAALKLLEENSADCDIALVDLNMKGMGGIELIKIMKERFPNVKILVLTTFYDDKYITEAIAGGAEGYLLKDSGKDAILGAIAQILGGITVLDQKVMKRLTELMAVNIRRSQNENNSNGNISIGSNSYADNTNGNNINKNNTNENSAGNQGTDEISRISADFTKREKEISSLMVEGLTNKQIADRLYISEGTVKNYISNIYDKTGIHDRVKLIVELGK